MYIERNVHIYLYIYIYIYIYTYIYIYIRAGAENLSRSSAFVHRLRGNADFSWAQPICHCASFWMKKMTIKYTLLSSGYLMCAENEGPSKMSLFFWIKFKSQGSPWRSLVDPVCIPNARKSSWWAPMDPYLALVGPDGSLIGSHGSPVVHNGSPMGPVLFGCALVRMKALRQDIILD